MSNQNDAATAQLSIGLMIAIVIGVALLFAGVVIVLLGVGAFVLSQWYSIYRYEGKKPVLWLALSTGILAFPLIFNAIDEAKLFSYYMSGSGHGDKAMKHGFLAIGSIVLISIPTAGYWLYRIIKPISHIRESLIDQTHENYSQGNITRIERDGQIALILEKGDDVLEKMVAESRRDKQPASSQNPFDVPPQDRD
ncbi:MAG: hypothetical protein AAF530_20055 [Pseudomonadota bacterium]